MIYKDRSGTYILKPALPYLAGGCIGCAFCYKGCSLTPDCIDKNIDINLDKRTSGRYLHWYKYSLNTNIHIL